MKNEHIVIPITPEHKTTPERFFWDKFIGALNALAAMSPEIDMIEVLQGFEKETEEDAVMLVYNYYLEITVEEGTSDSLENVEMFLKHSDILE